MAKKALAILIITAFALAAGCATLKTAFCANVETINKAIAAANDIIREIEAQFPDVIPPEYQLAINAAKAVVTQGTAVLAASFCPSDTETETVTVAKMTMTNKLMTANKKFNKTIGAPKAK